ncbi:MAG: hypothetical protein ONB25_08890 [candidate division KSB1 bacterium]|nr:hypothetical protein [candidate division KSB1 bacterium]
MKIWQITPPAAMVNSIAEFFIRHGVALLWPGDSGRWSPDRHKDDYALDDRIAWFAQTMADGDAILLRTGPARIRAVGLVAGEYSYEDRFDDVHGFDLQHCRRVRWCRLPEDYEFGESVFTQGRFSCVWKASVREYVTKFLASPPTHWQQAPLPELPAEEPPLETVPAALESVVAQAQDLAGLFWDGQKFGDHPSEDELVAHFVVPFLRALGWPAERIAVKWRYIDVAVFAALPRTPDNCRFVIEAKRLGAGVEGALAQARGYVESLGVPRDVIVTDGIRYRMYASERGFEPVAYANLVRLKQSAANLFDRMKRV